MYQRMVKICNGIGIINNLEIFSIGKETYNDKVNVQIRALIKNKFNILFPQIELKMIKMIQLNGIAYM